MEIFQHIHMLNIHFICPILSPFSLVAFENPHAHANYGQLVLLIECPLIREVRQVNWELSLYTLHH